MDANLNIPNLDDLSRQLRDASAVHDDALRYVRAARAAKIIGISPSLGVYWVRRGFVRAIKFRIPSQPGSVRGEVVAWRLDDAIEQAQRYWSGRCRRWSHREDDYLLERLGTMPIQQLATELGRSVKAVRMRAGELGLNQKNAQGELTTVQVAQLLSLPYNRVVAWCSRSGSTRLDHRRLDDAPRTRLIDENQLGRFLKNNPKIASKLSPFARQRVERLTMTSRDRRKAVNST